MSIIIGLHQAKHADNLANVVRAMSCYGHSHVQVTGPRMPKAMNIPRTHRVFRHKDHAHVQIKFVDEFDIPDTHVPIAVELVDGAQSLPWFNHPEQALYMFGPEDGSIPPQLLKRCHAFVQIPTASCLNLSHAVSTVLYDRRYKEICGGVAER